MSYIGVFGMCLKYHIVKKQNVSKDPRVERINKWTLAGGMCTLLGMLLVILCPTGHMRRDGGWYWPIFVPHSVGAGLVFVVGYVIAVLLSLPPATHGSPLEDVTIVLLQALSDHHRHHRLWSSPSASGQ
uniref:Putative dna damage-regulated autophagy modulator protein 1 n=1 Tax=Ixodes ricinus TaxID=34613 RepID=A0A0K8R4F0_IXORI